MVTSITDWRQRLLGAMAVPAPTRTDGPRELPRGRGREESVLGHWCCGLCALLAAAVTVAVGYPLVLALTRPLALLSSTAFVYVLVFVWVGVWLLLEAAWEWWRGDLAAGG